MNAEPALWIYFNWIRIRIKAFGESGSGSRFLKIILKTCYFLSKVQYKILRLPWSTSKLQKSLQPPKENFNQSITWNFFTFFFIFVGSFCVYVSGSVFRIHVPDPHWYGPLDPDAQWGKKLDPIRPMRIRNTGRTNVKPYASVNKCQQKDWHQASKPCYKNWNWFLLSGLEEAELAVPHKVHDVVPATRGAQDHQWWIRTGRRNTLLKCTVWRRRQLRNWIPGSGSSSKMAFKMSTKISFLFFYFLPYFLVTHPGSRIADPKTATKERGKKIVVIPFYLATNFTKLYIF